MKKNRFFIVLLVGLVSFGLVASPVWAGNVQRNRWEGVAIGAGAVILGKVLWDHFHYPRHAYDGYHHRPYYPSHKLHPPKHKYYPRAKRSGHWEIRKVWVPPVYEKVWNPGHYNRRGCWVPGKWIEIEKRPGYWDKERVWVAHRHHRRYH
jgi:hypothetical protein